MEFLSDFFGRLFQSISINNQLPKAERMTATKPIIGIEFINKQATKLCLWIEMACIDLELVPGMEYRIESDETEYRIEFEETQVTFWLQYRFGPKVLQRPYSADFKNELPWELVIDSSDIDYRLPIKP